MGYLEKNIKIEPEIKKGKTDLRNLSFDIKSLQEAYNKNLTPTHVIDEVYCRLAEHHGDNVWNYIIPHIQVLKQAQKIERLRGEGRSLPLYGVPFGVKDNIDVEGLPTSAGCPSFQYIATRTAAVVEKLQNAGAILIGKQNLDQFATGLVGIRSPTGYCRNPFNPDYIPGGSSSGSAVAVSTGQVSFAIGSDTGGSGRVPAALNNIVGLKPTPGLISTYGFLYANRTFDVAPIFALTTEDALAVFGALLGFDKRDIYSVHPSLVQGKRRKSEPRFRFGLPSKQHLNFFGDDLAEEKFYESVELLRDLGGDSVQINFSPFREAAELVFNSAYIAERTIDYARALESDAKDIHPAVRANLDAAKKYSAADAFKIVYRLEQLKTLAYAEFRKINLLALPTSGTIYKCAEVEADPIKLNANLGYYTYFANPLRLSAISVPAGFRPDGLPFGLCLLGLPYHDRILLEFAQRFQNKIGGRLGATEHYRKPHIF